MGSDIKESLRNRNVGYGRGAIAGLIGGIVMAMLTMMVTAGMGMGALALPKMIAGMFLGSDAAMAGGAGVIIFGLGAHMMLSILFGLVYAGIVNGLTHEFWVTGIAFGIAVWVVNFYAIGAVWPGAHMMAANERVWLAAMSHIIFGLVTAWVAGAGAAPAAVGSAAGA